MLPDHVKEFLRTLNFSSPIEYQKIRENYKKGLLGYKDENHRIGYLQARLPATYEVFKHLLKELPNDFSPQTFLDLGCGPGTASLGVLENYPQLKEVYLVDQDRDILKYAKDLLSPYSAKTSFIERDLSRYSSKESYDLISLHYVLGEVRETFLKPLLEKAWGLTQHFLILTLPGTPKDFELLLKARQLLLEMGAFLHAPCPHQMCCPLAGKKDWCHFKVHVDRSSQHQRLKSGQRGYEEEPYGYLIVKKSPSPHYSYRIIRPPLKRAGHLRLDVCSKNGALESMTLSKKNGEDYKDAKSLSWGQGY